MGVIPGWPPITATRTAVEPQHRCISCGYEYVRVERPDGAEVAGWE
jgi:hypothetical protein